MGKEENRRNDGLAIKYTTCSGEYAAVLLGVCIMVVHQDSSSSACGHFLEKLFCFVSHRHLKLSYMPSTCLHYSTDERMRGVGL